MAKSPNAFRTIAEAAEEVGTQAHVLRFWETKFGFIAPLKRAGGRRFYRPQDVMVLKGIKRLLHDDGLTIKGVLRLHKDQGIETIAQYGDPEHPATFAAQAAPTTVTPAASAPAAVPTSTNASSVRLRQVLAELEGARARLEAVLSRSA